MATNYETALMSQQAYEIDGGTPPDGWEIFVPPSQNDPTGFQGVAYRNLLTNEIVVAFRGTEIGESGDRIADLQIGLARIPDQYASARTFFYDNVLAQADADPSMEGGNYSVSLTGHSLGGGIAQLLGAETGLPTTTYNAPGVADVWVNQPGGAAGTSYSNITNINTAGDIVHLWDRQLGSAQTIQASSFGVIPDSIERLMAYASGIPGLGYYWDDQHGISNFVEAFSGAPPAAPSTEELNYQDQICPIVDPVVSTTYFSSQTSVPRRDPLVLDLDGDGLETITLNTTNPILFDHDGDGIKTATGWISPDDGLLVLDRNGNGTIDTGRELFGDATLIPTGQGGQRNAVDGFDALSAQDTNHDGVVNGADTTFTSLRIWRDLNQDGLSQSNELTTLAQNMMHRDVRMPQKAGCRERPITALNVAKTENNTLLPSGNVVADLGTYIKSDGTAATLGDVELTENAFYSRFTDSVAPSPGRASLHNARGSAALKHISKADQIYKAA